jgi:hypothetical protein
MTITAIMFGVLVLWQIVCLTHPRLPSLTVVVNLLFKWRITRWFLILGWLWWGWHVWVRGSW